MVPIITLIYLIYNFSKGINKVCDYYLFFYVLMSFSLSSIWLWTVNEGDHAIVFSLQCFKRKAVQCSTSVQTVSSKTFRKTDSRRTGWAVMSTSLPSQLNYMLCLLLLLLLYTFVKCCFNWHLEKKALVIWLPASVSCQLNWFFSVLFLVHHFVSLCFCLTRCPCSSLYFSIQLSSITFPNDCFSLCLSSLSSYLHILVFFPSPMLSPLVCSLLSSNLKKKLLFCEIWSKDLN